MIEIIKSIRDTLSVYDQIMDLLYVDSEKFVNNGVRTILNPESMRNIKEYISIKELICNSSPASMSGIVEWSMLQAFCD